MGVAMCTKGSGTNSVKPPVSRCSARVRTRWRAHERGCSTAPNMMVTFERSPTLWAARWASSHSSVVILSGHRIGPDLVVEDLRRRARQGRQPGVAEARPGTPASGSPEAAGPFGDLERGEAVDVDALRGGPHGPDHLEVVVAVEAGVDAALQADLGGARALRPRPPAR